MASIVTRSLVFHNCVFCGLLGLLLFGRVCMATLLQWCHTRATQQQPPLPSKPPAKTKQNKETMQRTMHIVFTTNIMPTAAN